MSFNVTYTAMMESEGITSQDSLLVNGTIESILADYVSKLNFKLAANQETNVEIPGLNAILSLMLVADKPVNISLGLDVDSNPIYDGTFSTRVSKYFGGEGITYDHIKVKANTEPVEVTLIVVGKEALPSL